MTATTNRRRIANDGGVVAVEFVLVMPFLLLLIFGIIQFGRAYNAKVELTGAVREGARVFALQTGDVEMTTTNAAAGLSNVQVCAVLNAAGAAPPSLPTPPCTPPSTCPDGDEVWVVASSDFDLDIPFYTGPNTLSVSAAGVMRCSG